MRDKLEKAKDTVIGPDTMIPLGFLRILVVACLGGTFWLAQAYNSIASNSRGIDRNKVRIEKLENEIKALNKDINKSLQDIAKSVSRIEAKIETLEERNRNARRQGTGR